MAEKGDGTPRTMKKKHSLGASALKKIKSFCPIQSQSSDSLMGSAGGRISRETSATDDANADILAAITGTGVRSGTSTTVCTPSHASSIMPIASKVAAARSKSTSAATAPLSSSASGAGGPRSLSMSHDYSHPFLKGEQAFLFQDEPDVCEPVRSMPTEYMVDSESLAHRSISLGKPTGLPERYTSAPVSRDIGAPAAGMVHASSYSGLPGKQQPQSLPAPGGMYQMPGREVEMGKAPPAYMASPWYAAPSGPMMSVTEQPKLQIELGTTATPKSTVANKGNASTSRQGKLRAKPLPAFPFLLAANSHFRVRCCTGDRPSSTSSSSSPSPCLSVCKLATIVDCIDRCLNRHKIDYTFHEDKCTWAGVRYTPSSFMNVDVVVYETPKCADNSRPGKEFVVELQLTDGDRGDFREFYGGVLEEFKQKNMEPILPAESAAMATRWGRRCHSERLTRSSIEGLADLVAKEERERTSGNTQLSPPAQIQRRPISGSYANFNSVPAGLRPPPTFVSHSHQSAPDRFDFSVNGGGEGGSYGGERGEIDDEKDLQPLIRLCRAPCSFSNLEGARMLSQLSAVDNNLDELAREEVVSALASLAKADKYPCLCPQSRAFAVFALSNLSESPQCQALIAKAGVLPALLKLAAYGCGGQQKGRESGYGSGSGGCGEEKDECGGISDIEMRRECARLLANLSASFGEEVLRALGDDQVKEWLSGVDSLEDGRLKMHAKRVKRLLEPWTMYGELGSPQAAVSNAGVVAF